MVILFKGCFLSGFQGRPKGVTPKYSLKPLVPRLSELLGYEVNLFLLCSFILNFCTLIFFLFDALVAYPFFSFFTLQ